VKRSIVVAALGTAQTLAWGSSYYLPAILADPIAQGLALSRRQRLPTSAMRTGTESLLTLRWRRQS
jgi:hypothetical protein